ncbi:MAG TPA: protease modulator HflK, partial [Paenalcaligenes sp.]|nr:protease modulator HflK [Paenalcaligenes sp.]
NVQPPEQVQAAFDDAVKAGQDRERQINEGNAYANKVLPEAQGYVARMLEEAEGYRATVVGDARGDTARYLSVESEYVKAPGVMRDRLYLSTMQEILETSSKVMVDVPTGNNMLYLPLDKITGQVARPSQGSAATGSDSNSAVAGAGAGAATGSSSNGGTTQTIPSSLGSSNSLANPYSPYSR